MITEEENFEEDDMFYLDNVLTLGVQLSSSIRCAKTGSGLTWSEFSDKFIKHYRNFLKGSTLSSEVFKKCKLKMLKELIKFAKRKQIEEVICQCFIKSKKGFTSYYGFSYPDIDSVMVEGINLASSFNISMQFNEQMSYKEFEKSCMFQYSRWHDKKGEAAESLYEAKKKYMMKILKTADIEPVNVLVSTEEAYTPPLSASEGESYDEMWMNIIEDHFLHDPNWEKIGEKNDE